MEVNKGQIVGLSSCSLWYSTMLKRSLRYTLSSFRAQLQQHRPMGPNMPLSS